MTRKYKSNKLFPSETVWGVEDLCSVVTLEKKLEQSACVYPNHGWSVVFKGHTTYDVHPGSYMGTRTWSY